MIIYQHWYDYAINVTIWDILGVLIIVGVVFLWAKQKASGKNKEAFYKYLPNAILIKVLAAIVFATITMLFYPGDTFEYFKYVNRLNTMLFTNSSNYFDILFNGNQKEYWSYFNLQTGYPAWYMWRDPNAIFVPRIYAPLMIITYKSFILSTIIAALIGFSGLWKLFIVFCKLYPRLEKKFAIAILYFPSILFWSSGLLKDTLAVAALGWIVYSFYNFAILYKFRIKYIVVIIICSIIIINIKSYIFAALLPGLLVWLFFKQLSSIKSGVIKFIVAPVLGVFIIGGFALLMSNLSGEMGAYGDVDKSLEQAKIIQEDLKRTEQYGENYYDIGAFDATPAGVISKAPIAIISGIFRPFIWEARNPFILLSGLENLFTLILTLVILFKTKFIGTPRRIVEDPLVLFSIIFTIMFAFGIGMASANFGALVRYRIPLMPFFITALFIMQYNINKNKNALKRERIIIKR